MLKNVPKDMIVFKLRKNIHFLSPVSGSPIGKIPFCNFDSMGYRSCTKITSAERKLCDEDHIKGKV
jgi:hypothetical protein